MSESRKNPYIGPRAYQTGEQLYGRDHENNELFDLLVAERIVLLHSPSGAGKSSLVQAGLIPRLRAEGFRVLPVIRLGLDAPGESITSAEGDSQKFNRFTFSTLLSLEGSRPEEQCKPVDHLASASLESYLEALDAAPSENQDGSNLSNSNKPDRRYPPSTVLIFDQFEEILTVDAANREAKQAFFQEIGTVLRDRSRWALFIIREDFLAALDPYLRPIPTRFANRYRLDLLRASAARQAIQAPARQEGVDFNDQAARKLIDDLRRVRIQQPDGSWDEQPGPYVEPVQLQVACYRLWENLPAEQMKIQAEDVANVGDVNQSLADYYAEQLQVVARETGVKERLVRNWFESKLITPQGTRGQVQMGQQESSGLDNRAVQPLESAHLIRGEKRLGATWYELAHDRLIQPILDDNQNWYMTNLSLLQRQALLWDKGGQPDSLLLQDESLVEAESWATANPDDLSPTEVMFLESSLELRTQHEQAQQLEQAKKQAETEKLRAEERARVAARLRSLFIVAVIAALLAGMLGIYALSLRQQEQQQRAIAESASTLAIQNQETAQSASTLAVGNQATAQFERGRAVEQQGTAEANAGTAVAYGNIAATQRSLAEENANLAATARLLAEENAAIAQEQATIADTRRLASLALSYLESRTPEIASLLSAQAYRVGQIYESRNALLATLLRGLERAVTPYGPPLPPGSSGIYTVAISPDGTRLAWGEENGTVTVWDITSQEPEYTFNHHKSVVRSLAFSPDSQFLATAGDDTWIYIYEVDGGRRVKQLPNTNQVLSLSWAPSALGAKLAAAVGARLVVWDVENQEILVDKNLVNFINSVAWSPDGERIATASRNGAVTLLDSETAEVSRVFRNGHVSAAWSMDWSPGGKILASAGEDGTIILWDVESGEKIGNPLEGHTGPVFSVKFNPTGDLIASGSGDESAIIWDLTERTLLRRLKDQTLAVTGVSFARGKAGSLLATGSRDRTVNLYQVNTQQPLSEPVTSLENPVLALVTNAQGHLYSAESGKRQVFINLTRGDITEEQAKFAVSSDLTSMAFSPDGQDLALAGKDGKIQVVDWQNNANGQTGRTSTLLTFQAGAASGTPDLLAINALAYSADGRLLASGRCLSVAKNRALRPACVESEIQIWNADNGEKIGEPLKVRFTPEGTPQVVDGPAAGYVLALAFMPDSEILAASYDDAIYFWNYKSGEPSGLPLVGQLAPVSSLAFSRDGATLASGSQDQTIVLWDMESRQPIGKPLVGSTGTVLSLVFTYDGKWMYSGSRTGAILRWDLDAESWIERNCTLAGRGFRPEERLQFLTGAQEYPEACE